MSVAIAEILFYFIEDSISPKTSLIIGTAIEEITKIALFTGTCKNNKYNIVVPCMIFTIFENMMRDVISINLALILAALYYAHASNTLLSWIFIRKRFTVLGCILGVLMAVLSHVVFNIFTTLPYTPVFALYIVFLIGVYRYCMSELSD